MDLEEEAVKQFKELYLKEYGVQLTNEQVVNYGSRLISFVRAVCGDNPPKLDNERTKNNN